MTGIRRVQHPPEFNTTGMHVNRAEMDGYVANESAVQNDCQRQKVVGLPEHGVVGSIMQMSGRRGSVANWPRQEFAGLRIGLEFKPRFGIGTVMLAQHKAIGEDYRCQDRTIEPCTSQDSRTLNSQRYESATTSNTQRATTLL